jgi:cellulose synthase/poly-beta-1,6-N-acetylglucosamine synthase-like glycosyltransferase
MLTRALFLAGGWFAISFIGLLIFALRVKKRSWWISFAWLFFVILAGATWAFFTFGVPREILVFSSLALVVGFLMIVLFKDWNAFGQVLWTASILVTITFLTYTFTVTAFTPLSPLSFLLAIIFFFIEAIALLLALTHTYESLDAMTRVKWRRRIDRIPKVPGYTPMVSLHVPTYNEPPEVVEKTLRELAKLDYPNFEVLVIDNNTPDESTWRAIEDIVNKMGPKFRYLHLDKWPGYKSGALNFALSQTAPDAEIIGSIDSDYQLLPTFLKDLVSGFADPNIAFVQTPQDYTGFAGHPYTEATYYGYKYFFEVSMPSRNEHNAIIFAGTMGLIRKSVLQEIGGWDEWCITEDAEASLRILKLGYKSIFINRTYGFGLMPFTFEGLKKQRFRWCFGGIQILRKHWENLMPWAPMVDPKNRLSFSQRYYYLAGGLQWYTELLNLVFAFFLILGALFLLLDAGYVIRPLTSALLVMPAVFLFLNMWRFLWVLRNKLVLTWPTAIKTMYNFFSLGWAVTLASIQGLVQSEGVFLRTPKSKSQSKAWRALQATSWETGIGLACLAAGIGALIHTPTIFTLFLALLLTWQSSLYLSAPVFSLMSMEEPKPLTGYQRRAVRENLAARWAMAIVLITVMVGVVTQFAPPPPDSPEYARYQPPQVPVERLLGLDRVPLEQRDDPIIPTLPLQNEILVPLIPDVDLELILTPTPLIPVTGPEPDPIQPTLVLPTPIPPTPVLPTPIPPTPVLPTPIPPTPVLPTPIPPTPVIPTLEPPTPVPPTPVPPTPVPPTPVPPTPVPPTPTLPEEGAPVEPTVIAGPPVETAAPTDLPPTAAITAVDEP